MDALEVHDDGSDDEVDLTGSKDKSSKDK